jgi:hypothetical protein
MKILSCLKRLASLILALSIAGPIVANATPPDTPDGTESHVVEHDGITYFLLRNGGASALGFAENMLLVLIPNTICFNGTQYPVTELSYRYWDQVGVLRAIIIPCNVKTLTSDSFRTGKTLEYVVFEYESELTHIGKQGLSWTSLVGIAIPSSVETTGPASFSGSKHIRCLTFARGSRLSRIGEDDFAFCSSLSSVTFPKSIATIASRAFAHCGGLEFVNFEKDSMLHRIENGAFRGCQSLQTTPIPCSVEFIDASAFVNCPNLLVELESNPDSPELDCAFFNEELQSIEISTSVRTIKEHDFNRCNNLGVFVLRNDKLTFFNTELRIITIPASVEIIAYSAFAHCRDLTTVSFGRDSLLQRIEDHAFWGCSSLTEIFIPHLVVYIGEGAFIDCEKLNTVEFAANSSLKEISSLAFHRCLSLLKIFIPALVEKIYGKVFYLCQSLEEITFEGDSHLRKIDEEDVSKFSKADIARVLKEKADVPSRATVKFL